MLRPSGESFSDIPKPNVQEPAVPSSADGPASRQREALAAWELYTFEGEAWELDEARGLLGRALGQLDGWMRDDGKTLLEDIRARWDLDRAIIAELRQRLATEPRLNILEALRALSEERWEFQNRARQLLFETRQSDSFGSYLLAHALRFASEEGKDAALGRQLLEDVDRLESRYHSSHTASAFYTLLRGTSRDPETTARSAQKQEALAHGKNFSEVAWDAARNLGTDDLAQIAMMGAATKIGSLARLAALRRLGGSGVAAIALGHGAQVAAEGTSLWAVNTAYASLHHDPAQVFSAASLENNLKSTLLMVSGLKIFGAVGQRLGPQAARLFGLVGESGSALSLGGSALAWGIRHLSGMSGMVATTQASAALGWKDGGHSLEESVSQDIVGYWKYGFSQKGFELLLGRNHPLSQERLRLEIARRERELESAASRSPRHALRHPLLRYAFLFTGAGGPGGLGKSKAKDSAGPAKTETAPENEKSAPAEASKKPRPRRRSNTPSVELAVLRALETAPSGLPRRELQARSRRSNGEITLALQALRAQELIYFDETVSPRSGQRRYEITEAGRGKLRTLSPPEATPVARTSAEPEAKPPLEPEMTSSPKGSAPPLPAPKTALDASPEKIRDDEVPADSINSDPIAAEIDPEKSPVPEPKPPASIAGPEVDPPSARSGSDPAAARTREIFPREGAGLFGLAPAFRFYTVPEETASGGRIFQARMILPNLDQVTMRLKADAEGRIELVGPAKASRRRAANHTVDTLAVEKVAGPRGRFQLAELDGSRPILFDLQPVTNKTGLIARLELTPQQPEQAGDPAAFFPSGPISIPTPQIEYIEPVNALKNSRIQGVELKYRLHLSNGDFVDLDIHASHHSKGRFDIKHAWLHRFGGDPQAPTEFDVAVSSNQAGHHRIVLANNRSDYVIHLENETPQSSERWRLRWTKAEIRKAPEPVFLKLGVEAPLDPVEPAEIDVAIRALAADALFGDLQAVAALGEWGKTRALAVWELKDLAEMAFDPEAKAEDFGGTDPESMRSALRTALDQVRAGHPDAERILSTLQAPLEEPVEATEALETVLNEKIGSEGSPPLPGARLAESEAKIEPATKSDSAKTSAPRLPAPLPASELSAPPPLPAGPPLPRKPKAAASAPTPWDRLQRVIAEGYKANLKALARRDLFRQVMLDAQDLNQAELIALADRHLPILLAAVRSKNSKKALAAADVLHAVSHLAASNLRAQLREKLAPHAPELTSHPVVAGTVRCILADQPHSMETGHEVDTADSFREAPDASPALAEIKRQMRGLRDIPLDQREKNPRQGQVIEENLEKLNGAERKNFMEELETDLLRIFPEVMSGELGTDQTDRAQAALTTAFEVWISLVQRLPPAEGRKRMADLKVEPLDLQAKSGRKVPAYYFNPFPQPGKNGLILALTGEAHANPAVTAPEVASAPANSDGSFLDWLKKKLWISK